MKVLLDTNVVLDAIAKREPFRASSQDIIELFGNFSFRTTSA